MNKGGPADPHRTDAFAPEIPQMRTTGIGHLLFAAGLAGLGVLSIFSGDFAFVWQPVPAGGPREAS